MIQMLFYKIIINYILTCIIWEDFLGKKLRDSIISLFLIGVAKNKIKTSQFLVFNR